ncbi:MAG: suppressor of fused domain protein [Zavarzinella sp.]|nr:suppressor of fused domain protein [Zavarzinella sp.]
MADDTDDSPGWHAIDAALEPIYGDREPLHYGTIVSYAMGGPDPIHGISAYKNAKPRPHWHFVTYGFSELWDKESTDPDVSGFGFELTFRPTRQPADSKPPNWALNFLQNLGRYVFETGNCFGVGHTMPLHGPIEVGSDTLIQAVSFVHDPQLPPISTPNGRVEFLQIVGLTMDELDAITSWNASAFLELRQRDDPLLLTDLSRASWLRDPEFGAKVARRTKQDGSSCGWLSLVLECDTKSDPVCVRIQAIAVEGFARRLLGRLPYGRELTLNGKDATAVFKPGGQSQLKLVEDAVMITLRDEDAIQLANTIHPRAGRYPIPGLPNAVLEVLRTEITDRHGKVVDVVG